MLLIVEQHGENMLYGFGHIFHEIYLSISS